MELSKRETYIAIAAVAALVLLLGDHYVITPLMESGAALNAEEERLTGELENAQRLFQKQRLLAHKWEELTAGGLTANPAEAESQLLHATQTWAADSGLALSAVKPERTEQTGRTREIRILASGTGAMRSVARFLFLAETTTLPFRISELQLGARRESGDDLSLQLRASTLYLAENANQRPTAAGKTGGTQ